MSCTAWQIDETRGPSALQPSCREGYGGSGLQRSWVFHPQVLQANAIPPLSGPDCPYRLRERWVGSPTGRHVGAARTNGLKRSTPVERYNAALERGQED